MSTYQDPVETARAALVQSINARMASDRDLLAALTSYKRPETPKEMASSMMADLMTRHRGREADVLEALERKLEMPPNVHLRPVMMAPPVQGNIPAMILGRDIGPSSQSLVNVAVENGKARQRDPAPLGAKRSVRRLKAENVTTTTGPGTAWTTKRGIVPDIAEKFLAAVKAKPGQRSEEIARALGIGKLPMPAIRAALGKKLILKGKRRGTRYFARAGGK